MSSVIEHGSEQARELIRVACRGREAEANSFTGTPLDNEADERACMLEDTHFPIIAPFTFNPEERACARPYLVGIHQAWEESTNEALIAAMIAMIGVADIEGIDVQLHPDDITATD